MPKLSNKAATSGVIMKHKTPNNQYKLNKPCREDLDITT